MNIYPDVHLKRL